MHALIIEDGYILALAIEDALRELGYVSFDIAPNTAAAIGAARARCPDLIIADQRLESGTGTDAIREICAEKPIPVVFVTGSADEVRAQLPSPIIVEKPFCAVALSRAVHLAMAAPYRSGLDPL